MAALQYILVVHKGMCFLSGPVRKAFHQFYRKVVIHILNTGVECGRRFPSQRGAH